MLIHYLKIAQRNLRKQWNYTLINVLGLSVAIAACILILLYVQYEFGFDRQHINSDRIYRVTREWYNADNSTSLHLGHVAPNIGPLLESDYPEIEHATRVIELGDLTVIENQHHFQEAVFAADPSFLKVFMFPLVAGESAEALNDSGSVVISETTASRIFGKQTAIGKLLKISTGNDRFMEVRVGAVMKDVPDASHFHFDILVPMSNFRMIVGDSEFHNWGSNNYGTYVMFEKGYDVDRFIAEEAPVFLKRHLGNNERSRIHLQKLTDIHLHSNLDSEYEVNGNIVYIYVLCGVAALVLMVAFINYVNLATAGSLKRANEVGVRKSLGAGRSQLMGQFISESVLLTLVSMLVALVLIELVLPSFNRLASRELSLDLFRSHAIAFAPVAILLIGGLAGGSPAFVLSGLSPVRNLRGKGQTGSSHSFMRKGLVVFQFVVTIVLLISVGGMQKQLEYCRDRDLGLKKENILLLQANSAMIQNYDSLKQRLMSHPQVLNIAASKRTPSFGLLDCSGARVLDGDGMRDLDFRVADVGVNEDFIPTYEIKMAAGRNFSRDFPTDSSQAFILNETAVERIGWSSPEDAIGRTFGYGSHTGTIIGVVKDFNYESFHSLINPIVFEINSSSFDFLSIGINSSSSKDMESVLQHIQSIWSEYNPNIPFGYTFLDERYNWLYQPEQRLGLLITVFSVLAIVIACLGLLGLAAFMTQQRTKEIGVRKVMGASVWDILFMLSWDMMNWVILANLIAWPVAWYLMNQWLQHFAYRTNLNLTLFILSGGSALLIAWLTVTWQTMKAANANPIKSLRYE